MTGSTIQNGGVESVAAALLDPYWAVGAQAATIPWVCRLRTGVNGLHANESARSLRLWSDELWKLQRSTC